MLAIHQITLFFLSLALVLSLMTCEHDTIKGAWIIDNSYFEINGSQLR